MPVPLEMTMETIKAEKQTRVHNGWENEEHWAHSGRWSGDCVCVCECTCAGWLDVSVNSD